jgi:putative membrane protein
MQHVRVPQPPFPFGPRGPMHFFGTGPGGGGQAFGLFVILIVAALVVLAVLMFARRHEREGGKNSHGSSDALRILNERLARGDIDPEDYSARRSLLTSQT